MTNLDGILKRRDITLLTKVHIVKVMAFPVVMYSCESWTLKKVVCWRMIDAFNLWCGRTLESPLDREEIKPVNLMEINPEYSLEGLMLKLELQYFGRLMQRADSLEKILMLGKIEGTRRRRGKSMRWLDSISDSVDVNLSKFWEMQKDRGAWCAIVHGVTKS